MCREGLLLIMPAMPHIGRKDFVPGALYFILIFREAVLSRSPGLLQPWNRRGTNETPKGVATAAAFDTQDPLAGKRLESVWGVCGFLTDHLPGPPPNRPAICCDARRNPVGVDCLFTASPGLKQPWASGRNHFVVKNKWQRKSTR